MFKSVFKIKKTLLPITIVYLWCPSLSGITCPALAIRNEFK